METVMLDLSFTLKTAVEDIVDSGADCIRKSTAIEQDITGFY